MAPTKIQSVFTSLDPILRALTVRNAALRPKEKGSLAGRNGTRFMTLECIYGRVLTSDLSKFLTSVVCHV